MISEISRQLFADTPSGVLYHYTSFSGMVGIVGSGELRASDIEWVPVSVLMVQGYRHEGEKVSSLDKGEENPPDTDDIETGTHSRN